MAFAAQVLMTFVLLLCALAHASALQQGNNYAVFSNNALNGRPEQVNGFATDADGQLWFGTSNGLYSFDGHTTRYHAGIDRQIYCLTVVDNVMFIGTDDGLQTLDLLSGEFASLTDSTCPPVVVRALARQGDMLWVGAANGLYQCDLNIDSLSLKSSAAASGLPNKTIYALAIESESGLFVGTYNGLFRLDIEKNELSTIEIPQAEARNNVFVNSLFVDTLRRCMWIGTEGSLFKFDKNGDVISQMAVAKENSIKSITADGKNNLLIGTDNGLFVYNHKSETVRHIVHDARNSNSLIGNIVWSIFSDRRGIVWIGTDVGVSMVNTDDIFIPIFNISGSYQGNIFSSILVDDVGQRLWLGGTNGLILTNLELDDVVWYGVGNQSHSLRHNRIRHVYQDLDKQIWLATDGGVHRFNERTRQFDHFNIVDSTGRRNANWSYHIHDDGKFLWIATCQGGVLVVEKSKLGGERRSAYIADFTITMANGLPNDYVEKIASDNHGNIYILMHRSGVYKIDGQSHATMPIDTSIDATVLYHSSDDCLWIGGNGRLTIIDANGERRELSIGDNNEIYDIIEEGGQIWASASNGLWVVDRGAKQWLRRVAAGRQRYTSLFYDSVRRTLYMGGIDGLAIAKPEQLSGNADNMPVFVTSLNINDIPLDKAAGARTIDKLDLDALQNNISLSLSDFDYANKNGSRYTYKLEGYDKQWHTLSADDNRVQYQQLKRGDYTLLVGKMLFDGTQRIDKEIQISIAPPWYLSWPAYVAYVVIVIVLIVWIVYFFDMKQKLQIEHIEKMKTLEQTQLKIDFFTSVSHEFKTPMSLVIGPLSQMIKNATDAAQKRELQTIMKHARRLNSMVNRALDFARIDNNIDDSLSVSSVEMVEFARSVMSMHRETPAAKNLDLRFESAVETAYVNVDAVKMESVLNNLISNACKYTRKGSVALTLGVDEANPKSLKITVADTGIGIPKDELPNVFRKFYRSSNARGNVDSNGIGLYLVRQYVERFNGAVDVVSEVDKGTTFVITLPLALPTPSATAEAHAQPETAPEPAANGEKLTVLIVEDNAHIADFIAGILPKSYTCHIAHNGRQGLDTLQNIKPDAIIADIMMPVMNGMEMSRRIKRNSATADIPIVMLTAKDDLRTQQESLANDVDAFISKPFEPQQLIMRIEQLVRSRRATESRVRLATIAEPRAVEVISADEKFLAKFIELVETHLSDNKLSMDSLADALSTTQKQMYRKIKSLTGQTPIEYINGIRMKKAADMLAHGSFTVAEVMYMVGHNNHSYFAKCFAAAYGCTPKQYAAKSKTDAAEEEKS